MSKRVISKRSHPLSSTDDSRVTKKGKTTKLPIYQNGLHNLLDVIVCGGGESGELGLGAQKRDGKKPVGVKSPRLNDLACAFGIVQIAAGGMHCATLTHDSKIVTWGVNGDGALGRDTQGKDEARSNDNTRNDSEDDDNDLGLNLLESTPVAISSGLFRPDDSPLVQVVTLDSAIFVLTAHGTVYGWGTFKVRLLEDIICMNT